MADTQKLVIMVTHGPDQPELASIPFSMAGGAVASDVEVVMGFQGDGCLLAKKGVADTVAAPGCTPLGRAAAHHPGAGRQVPRLLAVLHRHGLSQDDLVDGAEIVAAGRFVAEITSATNSLVY